MKNGLDYYPHSVNSHNHRKFRSLRRKYGWGGEGMFWALNNYIAQAEGCWLDLSDETVTDMLSDDFDMGDEEFKAFIDCLVNKIKLLLKEGDKVSTQTLQDTYGKVSEDREKKSAAGKKSAASRRKKAVKNEHPLNTCSTPVEQSKVKESKVKKSKGEEEGTPPCFNPDGQPFDLADMEDFAAFDANQDKEKSSAKKENGLSKETAARVIQMKRELSGESAPNQEEQVPDEAPFDLVADTVNWFKTHPAGIQKWASHRRYLNCGPNELIDPTKTVEAAEIILGPGKTGDPRKFRRSMLGCATTQLRKDREALAKKTTNAKSSTRKSSEPVITREQSVRVAERILAKRVAARATAQ